MSMRSSILLSAIALTVSSLWVPAGAQAAFGFDEFDTFFSDGTGHSVSQAGSHPFAFTTTLRVGLSGEELEGRLKELLLDEMPGLSADPIAAPGCTAEAFDTIDEGTNDCPDSTAVGIFEAAAGGAESWAASPVFNLVPPPGVLMRLGFRVADTANVIVDFELSPAPPYRLLANVGEFPQAVKLFGAKLQLWGVPSSPEHDGYRGWCAVHVGSCPSASPELPYITAPTSCEGPQASFYEASSWEGEEDMGYSLTHDDAEPPNPIGFVGCGKLGFDPAMTVEPTSEDAGSPTGVELVINIADEGLTNPAGIAQSQIRDVVLTLPAGLAIAPDVIEGLQYCTEADLEAETLESDPGEGCPHASELGTVEVESPLAEEPLAGAVFAGEPFEGSVPPNLYAVIKDHELGIIVKQLIEIEQDPESGALIAYAEDMPQLPLSRLSLDLRGDADAPLVTPPLCAAYDGHDATHEPIRAELTPWSGSAPLGVASSFQIVSGSNGGPCPTETGKHEPPPAATDVPVAPAATPSVSAPPDTTPPSATIRKFKLRPRKRIAIFVFGSIEPGARFLCKLDRRSPSRCRSPKLYKHLKSGRHRFKVWAIDAAGNKGSTPAKVRFMVPR